MMERYKILFDGGEGELTEKKSRFIATTRPVESEEEAVAFIDEMFCLCDRRAGTGAALQR